MTVVEDKHQKLREILIDYGSEEFGDAIVDEICELFGYPKTGCDKGTTIVGETTDGRKVFIAECHHHKLGDEQV